MRPPIPAKGNIRNKIKELEHPHTDISSDDESRAWVHCHQSRGTSVQ
jgi:hypothetical protein